MAQAAPIAMKEVLLVSIPPQKKKNVKNELLCPSFSSAVGFFVEGVALE